MDSLDTQSSPSTPDSLDSRDAHIIHYRHQRAANDNYAPETRQLVALFLSSFSMEDRAIISALSAYHFSYLKKIFPSRIIASLGSKINDFCTSSSIDFSEFKSLVRKIRDAYLQTLLSSVSVFFTLLDPAVCGFLEDMYLAENFEELARIQASYPDMSHDIDPKIRLFMQNHHINFFEFRILALQVFHSRSSI